jgi:formylglycine-generating enzyme required for sulfatase activity
VYKNDFGLTDMVGNVFQWCSDVFGPYVKIPEVNPTGPSDSSSKQRVIRGASFARKNFDFRIARRNGQPKDEHYYDVGFRLMAPVVQK